MTKLIQLENTLDAAKKLLEALVVSGVTPVFDIDGIALDATHRQKCYNQQDVDAGRCTPEQIGQLDLAKYRADTTADKVVKDKDLPLLEVMRWLNKLGKPYHVATARIVTSCPHSSRLFSDRGILPEVLINRGAQDRRSDSTLKVAGLQGLFSPGELRNMVLIDDSLGNCQAVTKIGMSAIHVPFDGH